MKKLNNLKEQLKDLKNLRSQQNTKLLYLLHELNQSILILASEFNVFNSDIKTTNKKFDINKNTITITHNNDKNYKFKLEKLENSFYFNNDFLDSQNKDLKNIIESLELILDCLFVIQEDYIKSVQFKYNSIEKLIDRVQEKIK